MLHAVIMAGGSGTRFWPLSRAARPKQLLSLVTEKALVVETVERLEGLVPPERVWIVTNAAYADRIRALLPDVPPSHVVAEPCGRDTAACIGLASTVIGREDEDAVLAILSADHVIAPAAAFREALGKGAAVVEESPSTLVTFGMAPTRPATGYGYIERGAARGEVGGVPWYRVERFCEKPDLETAKEFLAAGRFLWNGGIFVFRAAAMRERIGRFLPELAAGLPGVADELLGDGAISAETFGALPKISIDFGVVEKDDDVAVIEAPFSWDDVGSFAALERVLPKDEAGNVGFGDRTLLDASGNVVIAGDGHHVAVVGVEGLVVVQTADATLVCRKEDAQRVKEVVDRLKGSGNEGLV